MGKVGVPGPHDRADPVYYRRLFSELRKLSIRHFFRGGEDLFSRHRRVLVPRRGGGFRRFAIKDEPKRSQTKDEARRPQVVHRFRKTMTVMPSCRLRATARREIAGKRGVHSLHFAGKEDAHPLNFCRRSHSSWLAV